MRMYTYTGLCIYVDMYIYSIYMYTCTHIYIYITGEDAEELKALCPMGVFDIEDVGKTKKAVVGDMRKCTTCRECVRHEKFENKVDVGKLKDHFEFHVESVGMYAPEKLVFEALKILKSKAVHWLEVIEAEESQ